MTAEEASEFATKLASESRVDALKLAIRKLDSVERRHALLITKAQALTSQTATAVGLVAAFSTLLGVAKTQLGLEGIQLYVLGTIALFAFLVSAWAIKQAWNAQQIDRGADLAWTAIVNKNDDAHYSAMLIGHLFRVTNEMEEANARIGKYVARGQYSFHLFIAAVIVGALSLTLVGFAG